MTRDQTIRLTEIVFDIDVVFFLHIQTSKSDFSCNVVLNIGIFRCFPLGMSDFYDQFPKYISAFRRVPTSALGYFYGFRPQRRTLQTDPVSIMGEFDN